MKTLSDYDVRCRLVGREFAFLEERDDVFAPGSTVSTARMMDYNALKDNDDPDDPMVCFIVVSCMVLETTSNKGVLP